MISMKYVVFLGDGMADTPNEELGGKTPLECAKKPNIDALCKKGVLGLAKTVDDKLSPGSDVANLSVLGYDPFLYYTGRSPLEALSIGAPLKDGDVTFRANLVTLSDDENYADKTMVDYSSDEISTEESTKLIEFLKEKLIYENIALYSGISYRHLMIWSGGSTEIKLTPPHDISKRRVRDYLPNGTGDSVILEIMKRSYELLKDHPVNLDRIKRGLNPANSLWIWGEGTKPSLDNFYEKFGVKGSMISAVDLLKGIGKGTGMNVIEVPGATGNVHTNFSGKADAAINEFKNGSEFVYIHVEAADECGHRHETENKVRSIELIDEKIVGPVTEYLKSTGEPFAVLITPDHPTPLDLMTHTREPVPFVIYKSNDEKENDFTYTEKNAAKAGLYVEKGCTLINLLLNK